MVGTIFNLDVTQSLYVCSRSLSSLSLSDSEWTANRQLDSLAYVECITDAYSQYFVSDIEHTENNKLSKVLTSTCSYHLNKLLSASAWSSLSSLIIFVERTA